MAQKSRFKETLPMGKRTSPGPQAEDMAAPPAETVSLESATPPRTVSGRDRYREIAFFLPYARGVKGLITGTLICAFLVHVFRMPIMYIPTVLATAMEGTPDKEPIYRFLKWVMASVACMAIFTLARNYFSILFGESVLWSIRKDLYNRLERLSMISVLNRGAGEFVQRLTRDVHRIRDLFSETFVQIFDESSRGLLCAAACFYLEPVLTAIILMLFLVIWPIMKWINNRVERNSKELLTLSEKIIGRMVESISGFREIIASGKFEHFASRFGVLLTESKKFGVRTSMWGQFGNLIPQTVITYLILTVYWFGAGKLESGRDVGLLITYMMYLQQVLPVLGITAMATSEIAMATPSMREVRILLEKDTAPKTTPDHEMTTRVVKEEIESIRFENVSLKLSGRTIVKDLTFEIPGGKMTAIIGQSGAGKTTIFNLLLRLISPTSGTIWINDTPLEKIDNNQLRRLLGVIPQDPFIFDQSLRENLLVADFNPTADGQLNRVIQMAQLSGIIESRDGGLDASVGYMGSRLSGGERQRIALGRLFLQNPRVIICDEYTANIDVKTARLIQETMRTEFADRTRIVITHELYTIKGADHIIVLDRGRVESVGVHETLIGKPGLYRDLWEVQQLEESRVNGHG
ncbi:MAG: ABC transporter ATP-binding protein [Candidatus Omnitrophica bacterium]|nr:ABC transporter ATP-binding protein [Candidatus Omnitrophota bacterium]